MKYMVTIEYELEAETPSEALDSIILTTNASDAKMELVSLDWSKKNIYKNL